MNISGPVPKSAEELCFGRMVGLNASQQDVIPGRIAVPVDRNLKEMAIV